MADGSDKVATFTLNMGGDIDTAAKTSGEALDALRASISEGAESLRDYQKAMSRLKGAGAEAAPAIKNLKIQMAALKMDTGKAQLEYLKLGGSLKNMRPAKALAGLKTGDAATSVQDTAKAVDLLKKEVLSALPGLGKAPDVFKAISTAGGGLKFAVIGVATAVVVLAAAATAGVVALAKYGFAVLAARRAENLQLQGLVAMPNYWGRAAGSVDQMQASLDRVGAKFADRGALVGYQKALYQMGLRGNALDKALEGVAVAGAAAGDEGVAFAKAWLVGGGRMGASIDKTVQMLKGRFGAVAKAQMLSVDNQMLRLKTNFSKLFSGLKIEHFLEQLSEVIAIFAPATTIASALKDILTRMFSGASVASFSKTVKIAFEGIVIGALLIEKTYLKLRIAWKKAFGDAELFGNIDLLNTAVGVSVTAFGALAISLGAIVVSVGALGKLFAWYADQYTWAFQEVQKRDLSGLLLGMIVSPLQTISSFIAKAVITLSVQGYQLGVRLIDGIVNGIVGGTSRAIGAIKGLASGMAQTFRDIFQIHSPSKLMADFGGNITKGAALGIDRSAEKPVNAMRDLSESMAPTASRGSAGNASRTNNTTVQVTIQNMTVGSEDQGRSFVEQLAKALETISIQVATVPA